MRVAILLGYGLHGSGSTIYALELARSLARLGHTVHLMCHEAELSVLRSLGRLTYSRTLGTWCQSPTLPELSIRSRMPTIIPVSYPRPEIPAGVLLATITEREIDGYVDEIENWLHQVHQRANFDLILVNHMALLCDVTRRFHQVTGIPYRIIVHGTGLIYGVRRSTRVRDRVHRAAEYADEVIALNNSVSRRVCRVFPSLAGRCRQIPPGTDIDRFAFISSPTQPRHVAYVGRVTLDKGLHCLLAAWPHVIERYPEAKLVVAGDGPDLKTLRDAWHALVAQQPANFLRLCTQAAYASRSHASAERLLAPLMAFLDRGGDARRCMHSTQLTSDAVEWRGRLERKEVAELLQESGVAVLPSVIPEAHPLSVCEALATGTPVVGTDKAGIRHILERVEKHVPELSQRLRVSDELQGFIPEIARKINDLLESYPTERIRYRARRYIASTYAWRSTAQALLAGIQPKSTSSSQKKYLDKRQCTI